MIQIHCNCHLDALFRDMHVKNLSSKECCIVQHVAYCPLCDNFVRLQTTNCGEVTPSQGEEKSCTVQFESLVSHMFLETRRGHFRLVIGPAGHSLDTRGVKERDPLWTSG